MSRVIISLVAFAGLLFGMSIAEQEAEAPSHPRRALAELIDRDGNSIGIATFTEVENDAIRIELQIVEFAAITEEGEHAVHIHDTGECEPPDFDSAGDHYNPTDQEHGLLNPEGPHAGDLPNIRFDAEGNASYDILTQRVTLDETGLLSSGGTSLILHENADDHTSEAETGDRIACGVLVPHPDEAD